MIEAWRHFILLPSYFFLSDCRVSPGECGFTSSDGSPGTNGVITKLAVERGIKSISAILQAALFRAACEKAGCVLSISLRKPQMELRGPEIGRRKLSLLSIVVPAVDEANCIAATVNHLHLELESNRIPHEIVVVNDGSKDRTWSVLQEIAASNPALRPINNEGRHGFGRAVIRGIDAVRGDAVVVVMADESDDCHDVVEYWRALNDGWDCVFGSRFVKGGNAIDYPWFKLIINRLANLLIRILFQIPFNDTTNAFKAYRKTALDGCRPFLSPHFNLTVELPLKAIARGYSWTVLPVTWRNRRTGAPKFKIKEMGSRYFFIIAYVWLEKYFSRGDYRKVAFNGGSASTKRLEESATPRS